MNHRNRNNKIGRWKETDGCRLVKLPGVTGRQARRERGKARVSSSGFVLFWAFEIPWLSMTFSVIFQSFPWPKFDHFAWKYSKIILISGTFLPFSSQKITCLIYFVQPIPFSMTFHDPHLNSMTFQVFHAPYEPCFLIPIIFCVLLLFS